MKTRNSQEGLVGSFSSFCWKVIDVESCIRLFNQKKVNAMNTFQDKVNAKSKYTYGYFCVRIQRKKIQGKSKSKEKGIVRGK